MHPADAKDLTELELPYPDGRAWPGNGAYANVQVARIIG